MFSKCECCKHYEKQNPDHIFQSGRCKNPKVFKHLSSRGIRGFHTILMARAYCDPKGDGTFTHYEPKPGAGACFVQITREPKAMAAGA